MTDPLTLARLPTQMYVLSKGALPMDVGFMYSDTLEHLQPKLVRFATYPEAALAVEDMMAAVAKEGERS